jgi:hypothetical protein
VTANDAPYDLRKDNITSIDAMITQNSDTQEVPRRSSHGPHRPELAAGGVVLNASTIDNLLILRCRCLVDCWRSKIIIYE